MYVCLCNAVTDRAIQKAVADGASSMRQLSLQLGVSTCCGKCAPAARALLLQQLALMTRESIATEEPAEPVAERAALGA